MLRIPGKIALLFSTTMLAPMLSLMAQTPKSGAAPAATGTTLSTEKAMALAQQGRCKETLPTLKRAASGSGSAEIRKQAGVLALRCAVSMDDRASATELLLLFHKQFPEDPEILFIATHAYSDLSSRTALDLVRVAPNSTPARKTERGSAGDAGQVGRGSKAV